MYTEEEVREATLQYFNGDELATNVFITKYCLRDKEGNLMEKTPDDMHDRMAKEFARIQQKQLYACNKQQTLSQKYTQIIDFGE